MVTAMASGELEVANFAYSTLGIAIKNAGMDDLRVIAHEFRDGAAGHYSQEYLVLADGPVKSLADLKGKVIATNAAGSAVDVATRAMLRKAGLEDKRDYTVVEAPFPAMRAMLAEKKVDLVPGVLPFSLDPELRKIARPIFSQRDAIGETEMIVWAVRKPFIDKNRAAMVDFMEDTLRIVRWYLDPANQKAAAEIALLCHQAAGRALRLALHKQGLLPRPRHATEPRGVAKEPRHDHRSRLREGQGGPHRARRSFPRQRGSRAHQIG